jgi:hypothetical protein
MVTVVVAVVVQAAEGQTAPTINRAVEIIKQAVQVRRLTY